MSCPFVGNDTAVRELRSWLLQWKNKHSNPERSGSRHAFSDSEESTEGLSNCYLLAGPPGVGKTSSVYYLAEELGFKVLEVHASSERPGKKILAQLHEATQSHHVQGSRLPFVACAAPQPISAEKAKPGPKPKNVGPLQMMFEKAHAKSQDKTTKIAVESRPKAPKKGTLDSFFPTSNKNHVVKEPETKTSPKGTLLDYFSSPPAKKGNAASESTSSKRTAKSSSDTCAKISSTNTASSAASDDDIEVIGVAAKTPARAVAKRKPVKRACSPSDSDDDFVVVSETRPKKAAVKQKPADKAKAFFKKQKADEPCDSGPLQPVLPAKKPAEQESSTLKFSSHTIILFDDVDTIFEQDDGFWGAVESVLATTKKPVVFTATRNLANVRAKLPSGCPTAKFVHPSPDQVAELVTHICSSEAISMPLGENINFLLQYYHCDVRKCILQLQFDSVLCVLEQGAPFSARDLPVGDDLCKRLQSEVLDTRAVTQCMFEDLGLDVTHLCLPNVLPLTTVLVPPPLKEDSNVLEDAGEGHHALDFSWLSDEACEPESACESSQDNRVAEVHPQAPLIKQCLLELANMFDAFSDVDCMYGCFERCAYSACCMLPSDRIEAWQNGGTASSTSAGAGEFPLPFAVSDALNHIKVGSVKLASSNLETCLDGSKDAISELNVAVSSSVPSLTNIYEIAEQNQFWGRCRQQIVDSGVPVGAVLSSGAVSDYTDALQIICKAEKLRKCLKAKRAQRFLHYLNSCGIFLPEDIMVALCRGFGAKSCV
ncbi:hypothetical protein HPB48_005402 [Haemaphysalis longicornis]|uniref:ATPase AAA-type core domain-containing protein n=1 Tax=Haemaphysalis longicornis TaxID=44386 RepID=A0A9J6GFD8_HAELO|nr:hypothetical protein HPB48_005402 [Haemaphysalis longicornis]